jgi:hypothetical protein
MDDEATRQSYVDEMFKNIVGATIEEVRVLSDAEIAEMDWQGDPHLAYTLYLSNGLALTPSRDEEGNGPGHLIIEGTEVDVNQLFPDGIGPDHLSYEEACNQASDAQGITAIRGVLSEAGIESVVEQAGGLTMVAYVCGENGVSIGLTAEGAYLYTSDEEEGEELAVWGDGSYVLRPEDLELLVATVRANLPRLGL